MAERPWCPTFSKKKRSINPESTATSRRADFWVEGLGSGGELLRKPEAGDTDHVQNGLLGQSILISHTLNPKALTVSSHARSSRSIVLRPGNKPFVSWLRAATAHARRPATALGSLESEQIELGVV